MGRKRYPLVLMLEPLFRCNLACAGCGKIQYPPHVLDKRLTPQQCFDAVEECGAPMVSIPGGEPLIHPEIKEIVDGLVARKKYIYLCTNALSSSAKLDLFKPSKYLTFSVHLDGLKSEHDTAGLPRRHLRHRGRGDQGSGQARLPRHHQHHPLQRRHAQHVRELLRRR
jgi:hopanoid biosynthesis associated radical SAM protein HpnH